jgi:PTH1 family peptidyl-tRNA hydrolase
MWLFVGLGNPGARYEHDRHNIGFRVLDTFQKLHQFPAYHPRSRAQVSQHTVAGESVLLCKPQTYMNLSGESVAPLSQFHNVELSQIVVIHDELDLELGRLQLKKGGGEGGHNGLKSISAELGERDYIRLRFGIGRPASQDISISDYVLSSFEPEHEEVLEQRIADAVAMLESCCREGLTKTMNLWNQKSRRKKKQSSSSSKNTRPDMNEQDTTNTDKE